MVVDFGMNSKAKLRLNLLTYLLEAMYRLHLSSPYAYPILSVGIYLDQSVNTFRMC